MLFLIAPSFAAAYYFLDSNARAIGRGGAYVVGADDISAQYYNPAALHNIQRGQFTWNGWAVDQYVRFDRADELGDDGVAGTEDDLTLAEIENESGPMLEPSFGYAAPLGGLAPWLSNTTLAVGFYVPSSPLLQYPEDGAQRYVLVDALTWAGYAGPSIAQRVTPWLTIGLGGAYTFLRAEQRLSITTVPGGSDDPMYDVTLGVKAWDTFQMTWNAGFVATPTKWLQIGGSFQPPIKYKATGSLTGQFNEEHPFLDFVEGDSATDDDISLSVTLPMTVRAGAQVMPNDKMRFEGDFTWTNWGKLQTLLIDDIDLVLKDDPEETVFLTEDVVVTTPVEIIVGFQDAWSLRFGGDYTHKWLTGRAGVHYETSAVPSEIQGVGVVDGNKWGYGLGATAHAGQRFAFDLGFAQQFLANRNITDSELTQLTLAIDVANPENTAVGAGKVVGNGAFASRLTFAAVGATVYFGKNEP